jgi:hypothetical protein
MSIAVQSNGILSPAAAASPAAKSSTRVQGTPKADIQLDRLMDKGSGAMEQKRKDEAAQADRAEFDRLQAAYDAAKKTLDQPGGAQRLDNATGALAAKAANAYRLRAADMENDPANQPAPGKQLRELVAKTVGKPVVNGLGFL